LKTLGQGRETKREIFEGALAKEKRGDGDESTRDILYEKREVREWDSGETGRDNTEDELPKSTFIDYRPQSAAGKTGFGFQGLKAVSKTKKLKYNWRARLEQEKARKHGVDIYVNDGESSSHEESEIATSSDDGIKSETDD
jgi:ATP-dependent RNA helicase DHX37/DHR1